MSSLDWVLITWFFIVGACVGSFLNVVVYRLPRGGSLLRPASRCPSCGQSIRPWDNIPVLSWFLLRGRCRDCGAKISWRYPLVEAIIGFWFVGCSSLVLTTTPELKASAWMFSILSALFGAAFFSAALIVQDGAKVPRLINWVLLISLVLTLFALTNFISS